MNYIGSKYSLLANIERALDAHGVPRSGVALDLFSGTGTVAQFLKRRGHIAYANDWQAYSYATCVALLRHNEPPEFQRLRDHPKWGPELQHRQAAPESPGLTGRLPLGDIEVSPAELVLGFLSSIPGSRGPFYEAYCEGGAAGRLYFSWENGMRIQAVRDRIEFWGKQGLLTDDEKAWLTACLIEAADKVANTASVYGAFLKHIKASAQRPLPLACLEPVPSKHPRTAHRVFCADAGELASSLADTRLSLVYIDPPYNSRQYNANYHILETIARWDVGDFEPRGVTGLRPRGDKRSPFCLRGHAEKAFDSLLGRLNAQYVLFSYNNEGLVPKAALERMFGEHCTWCQFTEIPYKRFRADVDKDNRVYSSDQTVEYLILGALKQRGARPHPDLSPGDDGLLAQTAREPVAAPGIVRNMR